MNTIYLVLLVIAFVVQAVLTTNSAAYDDFDDIQKRYYVCEEEEYDNPMSPCSRSYRREIITK